MCVCVNVCVWVCDMCVLWDNLCLKADLRFWHMDPVNAGGQSQV